MVIKPEVNGSVGTWGTVLNTALDDLQNQINTNAGTASAYDGRIGTVENRLTTVESAAQQNSAGGFYKGTEAQRGGDTRYSQGGTYYETDTGRYWLGTSTGWVPTPGSIVFKVRQIAAQAVANGTDVTLLWGGNYGMIDLDRYNVGLIGGTNGPNYKPGIAGWYQFTGAGSFTANADGARTVTWTVNGLSTPGAGASYAANNLTQGCPARALTIKLTDSDYVSMVQRQTSGVALQTGAATSFVQPAMQVVYLGPA